VTVIAVAEMYGLAGRRDELLGLLRESERDAADAPGCLRYTFAATLADRDRFALFSEWESDGAMEAHYGSPAFARFQFALNGLLARPSTMTVYSVAGAARPLRSGLMDPRDAD
jgi:quinol monooxygenase YgiN